MLSESNLDPVAPIRTRTGHRRSAITADEPAATYGSLHDLEGIPSSSFPGFACGSRDLRIHFVHAGAVTPVGPVLSLHLSHGWPDSFSRYSKIISLLADPGAHGPDPADACDVVVLDIAGLRAR
jgi:hypothetical protein